MFKNRDSLWLFYIFKYMHLRIFVCLFQTKLIFFFSRFVYSARLYPRVKAIYDVDLRVWFDDDSRVCIFHMIKLPKNRNALQIDVIITIRRKRKMWSWDERYRRRCPMIIEVCWDISRFGRKQYAKRVNHCYYSIRRNTYIHNTPE